MLTFLGMRIQARGAGTPLMGLASEAKPLQVCRRKEKNFPHLQRDQSRALSVLSNCASSQPIHSVEPYIADKYDYAVGLRGPTNPSYNVTIASFVFLILCTRQLYRVIQQSMGP